MSVAAPPPPPSPKKAERLRSQYQKIDRSAGTGMAWVFIVFGLMFVGFGAWTWWSARQMSHWPSAQATIVSSDITSRPVYSSADEKGRRRQTGIDYEINVVFHYLASDGIPRDALLPRVEVWNDRRSAELRQRDYPVGSKRRIIYDPDMASSIALGAPSDGGYFFLFCGIPGGLISGFGLWLRLRQG